jgi:hypothetical protein
VWRHETVGRALGELGREPVWFYLRHMAWMALPWWPFAVAAIPGSWRRARRGDSREQFLWIWFATQFVIVSLSADKHKHYIAPALPVLSLWAGRILGGLVDRYRQGEWRLSVRPALALGLGGLVLASAATAVVARSWPGQTAAAAVAAVAYVACGWTALAAFTWGRPRAAAVAATVQFVASFSVVIGWIAPAADPHRPMVEFTRNVGADTPANETVFLYRMDQDPAVFYLSGRAQRVETIEELKRALAEDRPIRVMAFGLYVPELGAQEHRRVLSALNVNRAVGHPKEGSRFLLEVAPANAVIPAGHDERLHSTGAVIPASAMHDPAGHAPR